MSKRRGYPDLNHLRIDDIQYIVRSDDNELLIDMVQAARSISLRNFGRAVSLYAPLYISNYCRNECLYCGFQVHSRTERRKLDFAEIENECAALAATGIRSCLILTGESRYHSPPEYIRQAVLIARKFFANVSLEIYPLDTHEYHDLFLAGADGVTLFQETYDRIRYAVLHPGGPKRNFEYRFGAPERIAEAGFRHISMGVLLGLSDWQNDVNELFRHLRHMEKTYPGVEYALSFPRLRALADDRTQYFEVSDREMVKIICAGRILFPRVGINISTREDPSFRDMILELGITKMSAGSLTTVGGYADQSKKRETGQFQVHDSRSLAEIKSMLSQKGYDPVLTEWRYISNE
ncbi:MAG TPA: 2-iminoacetate synthase ThiH [Syntrophorhabdaceae bacterium]|nr:2-iminoacetate synthase ThiH [Syntrophorhabdaceae bacterium]